MTPRAIGRIAGTFALLALLAGWATSPVAPPRTYLVSIKGFQFAPAKLTITVGDTIAWANEDVVIHTVTGDTARWDSGDLATGKQYKVVASRKGTLTYHCELHPTMKGTLLVN